MKVFARWLYMKCYRNELGIIAKRIRAGTDKEPESIGDIEWKACQGALDTLNTLELLIR